VKFSAKFDVSSLFSTTPSTTTPAPTPSTTTAAPTLSTTAAPTLSTTTSAPSPSTTTAFPQPTTSLLSESAAELFENSGSDDSEVTSENLGSSENGLAIGIAIAVLFLIVIGSLIIVIIYYFTIFLCF
jgi:hypothetical protein